MLELYLDFQGFINIAQTQHMAESWVNFVRVAEYRQIFLRPDMSSYAAENSNHIQPQVVLLCGHNIIMRILNKIQLVVELNLVFLRVYQHRPNVLQKRSATRGCLGRGVSSFNELIHRVVNRNNIQPMVEHCDRIWQKNDMCANIFICCKFSQPPENSDHVQP